MSSARIELLSIFYLSTSQSVHGFTTSSFHSLPSLTKPILPMPTGSRRLTVNLKNRKIIKLDKSLFYSSVTEGISFANDTLSTSFNDTLATSSPVENTKPVDIINDASTEQVTIEIPELLNTDASSEQQALKILNDIDVEEFVSDILPESPPGPTSVQSSEILQPIVDSITVVEPSGEDIAISESLQSPELLQPIVDDIKLVEPSEEVLQLLSSEVSTSKVSSDIADASSLPAITTPEKTEESQDVIDVPNVKSISRFAIAALGVWLCSPILSLIDTSAVGLLSGTAQQAALNPAVSVTEYTALLIAFMYTGTTNLIASAQEHDRLNGSQSKTADAFRASLQLSTFVGTILGGVMLLSASTLLRMIIGKNNSLDPVVFSAALKYVKIRALGMPAAAITGSAQAACLGMKDTRSPLLILVMAASINLLGDIVLVRNSNAWIGGAAGAAWATVFSQYTALFMFMKWLTKSSSTEKKNINDIEQSKINKYSPLKKLQQKLMRSKNDNTKRKNVNNASKVTKGLLAGKMSKRTLLQFPPINVAKQFWPYFLPVTTTSVGRVSAYVAMAHVISSAIGTSAMAAQQIILSFFFCLTPIADSLSLTAQSFVPAFMERINQMRGNALDNAIALRKLTTNMFKTSFFFVLGTLGVVASMPLTSRFFTSDPIVLSQVRSITPYVLAWFSFHAVSMSAEGILLGRKDLSFLGKSYGIYSLIIPIIYLKIKAASLAGVKIATLASVWQVFIMYGLSRLFIWNARLIQQTLKTMRLARRKSEEETVFG